MKNHKKCLCCKKNQPLEKFYKGKRGVFSRCKKCTLTANKTYRNRNLDKYRGSSRKRYWKDPEKARHLKKEGQRKFKDQKAKYDKKYRKDNKERIAKYKKDWERRNRNNPINRIKRNLRRRLLHALKGNLKSNNTFYLLGCSTEEFKKYLEGLFLEGMSWDNYGQFGWHIDHIKPCHKFDLSKEDQQKECFHYTNLRPLWWRDNLTRRRNIEDANKN